MICGYQMGAAILMRMILTIQIRMIFLTLVLILLAEKRNVAENSAVTSEGQNAANGNLSNNILSTSYGGKSQSIENPFSDPVGVCSQVSDPGFSATGDPRRPPGPPMPSISESGIDAHCHFSAITQITTLIFRQKGFIPPHMIQVVIRS